MNELRVEAGDKENEATADLPGAPANTPNPEDAQRILQSIRDARQHADLVIVYQHNHVFANHSFSTIFTEGMPERLAPNEWLKKWTHAEMDAGADIIVMHGAPLLHGVEIYRGRPIFYDLGNLHLQRAADADLHRRTDGLGERGRVRGIRARRGANPISGRRNLQSISLRPIVLNNVGEGQPDIHNEYTNNQFLDTRGLPSPADRRESGLHPPAAGRRVKAFRHDD